ASPDLSFVVLEPGCTYTFTESGMPGSGGDLGRFSWFGPSALPAISSPIHLFGNGATIARADAPGTPPFRLFYVAASSGASATGDFATTGLGELTEVDVTLSNGLAKSGSAGRGGAGAGMGGASFNHGSVMRDNITLVGNSAVGGDTGIAALGGGGG